MHGLNVAPVLEDTSVEEEWHDNPLWAADAPLKGEET
jgi:hypothetical protein